MNPKEGEFDRFAPENISAVVGWLASDLSAGVTGQVVKVMGGQVQLLRGWRPVTEATDEKPWTIATIDDAADRLFAKSDEGRAAVHARARAVTSGHDRTDPDHRPLARRHQAQRQRDVDASRPRGHLRQAPRRSADHVPGRLPPAARDADAAGSGLLGADPLRRRDAGVAAIRTRSTPRRARPSPTSRPRSPSGSAR